MAKILVVEDDRDISMLIRMSLEGAGHHVETCTYPTEAFELADAVLPDLVILDVGLPQMSGLDLLQQLRTAPARKNLPAIFLSALVQKEDVAAGEDLGAIYLTKPFAESDLLAAVDRVVRTGASW